MDTSVDPISFTGKATLVKETQGSSKGWYISWNPTFLFPRIEEQDKARAYTLPPKRGEIVDRAGRHLGASRVDGIKNELKNEIQFYSQGEASMNPLHLALVYSTFINEENIVSPSLLFLRKQGEETE